MLTSGMCGIFGCKPVIDDWVKRSTVKQHSRGPDQSSEFIVGNIGLAVNRLAITGDLEQGAQPIFSKSKKTVCVFNGALYNYEDLIREYSLDPVSKNDAAVALELFELKGIEFFNYIQGMFSIILVDIETETMIVGRDNLGIKPLILGISWREYFVL